MSFWVAALITAWPLLPPAEVLPERIVLTRDRASLDALLKEHPSLVVLRRFDRLNGAVVRGPEAMFDLLETDPRVSALQRDALGHPMTNEAATLTGVRAAQRELGLTGRGQRVAVLDTGIDVRHGDLDGGVIAQKCFVLGGCPPMNGDTGDLAPETSGHGTHVTGIITGDGRIAPRGVAPEAEVVVVRVFNQQLVGRVSDWAAALDWVLARRDTLGIRAVNMSLGTNMQWPGACDSEQPALTEAVGKLRDAGVVVFAASGNERNASGMTAPACVTGVVSVGAVYDSDLGREPDNGTYASGCFDERADAGSVCCFSNSSPLLDLLAPGARIRSTVPGGGAQERQGTSQATPHVTALAALLFELDPRLTVADLEAVLSSTGRPITDSRNGRVTPLVQAQRAVEQVRSTQCERREDFESCELGRACIADAGCEVTSGTCFERQCVLTSSAFDGRLEAAGCSATAAGGGLVALLLLVLRRLRS